MPEPPISEENLILDDDPAESDIVLPDDPIEVGDSHSRPEDLQMTKNFEPTQDFG